MRIKLCILFVLCFVLVSCSTPQGVSSSFIDSILVNRESSFSTIESLGFKCSISDEDLVFRDREYLMLEKDDKVYKFSSKGDINIISQIVGSYNVRIILSSLDNPSEVIVELIGLNNEGVVTNRYNYKDYSNFGNNEESGRFITTIISAEFIDSSVNDLEYIFCLLKDLFDRE